MAFFLPMNLTFASVVFVGVDFVLIVAGDAVSHLLSGVVLVAFAFAGKSSDSTEI